MRTLLFAIATVVALARSASAFCGFYVAGSSDQPMFNDATQVVLMRMGTRTVLSMQNSYKGPPENFAMVIPVPTVLHDGDVKTLTKEVFTHVEQMGAPRLVEYWERDPCAIEPDYDRMRMAPMASAGMAYAHADEQKEDLGVKIEAQFTVAEYQIVILSAKDSTGLATWLEQEHYKIPPGAEPLLRPYVETGMKFFVAKVDPQKVQFVDGRAALSPLRFHYDSDEFALPIRLGLANSSGTQDLIVNILAPNQRYQVANYKNVTIPTNLDLAAAMKDKFPSFYTALYDRTVEKNPGAVVTEYAWQATTCDPCPGPALNYQEFATLGADVLGGTRDQPAPYTNADFVLTRLHARYGKSITDDLRFEVAKPIVGGREHLVSDGKLEEGAKPDAINNFQGRYAIRHEWTGPIACAAPKRGVWGGPPNPEPGYTAVKPAVGLAFAPRGVVALQAAVLRDIPEIDVKVGAAPPASAGSGGSAVTWPATAPPAPPVAATDKPRKSGCGCQASGGGDLGGGAVLAGVVVLAVRRRRRAA